VLAKRPLVALDDHAEVFANCYRACSAPSLRTLSHQFPSLRVNASALLRASRAAWLPIVEPLGGKHLQQQVPEVFLGFLEGCGGG
jgi:hypothetical protein